MRPVAYIDNRNPAACWFKPQLKTIARDPISPVPQRSPASALACNIGGSRFSSSALAATMTCQMALAPTLSPSAGFGL
jgi:hypothetical protein